MPNERAALANAGYGDPGSANEGAIKLKANSANPAPSPSTRNLAGDS